MPPGPISLLRPISDLIGTVNLADHDLPSHTYSCFAGGVRPLRQVIRAPVAFPVPHVSLRITNPCPETLTNPISSTRTPQGHHGAALAVGDPTTSKYSHDGGLLELRDAPKAKVAAENGLQNAECMVTTGANQVYRHLRTSAYRHLRTSVMECLHLPPFFTSLPLFFFPCDGCAR